MAAAKTRTQPRSAIRFTATICAPRIAETEKSSRPAGSRRTPKSAPAKARPLPDDSWCFLVLPKAASAKLPSRGQVTVEGTVNTCPFVATLDPDGQGGHWMKIERTLLLSSGTRGNDHLNPGDEVKLEITPVAEEPEPEVPADLLAALADAPPGKAGTHGAREAWADITPAARRDFIHWITSGKKAETRAKRIATACDMLAKGKRRPCCFDRSGMYSKSLSCPAAEESGPR